MLFHIAMWLALSYLAVGLGLAAIIRGGNTLAEFNSNSKAQDVLLFSAWLGIALIALASFFLALWIPLSAFTSLGLLIFTLIVAFWGWQRAARFPDISTAWRNLLPVVCILAAVLSERSSSAGNLDDSGGYHWSLIRWYGEFGIPTGLGLFQWRLATHSSWLAFSALFDHGFLTSRVGNLANGLLFLWSLTHLALGAWRISQGNGTKGDAFVVAGFFLILSIVLAWDMRRSPSPDIPIFLFCVVIGWAFLQFRRVDKSLIFGRALVFLAAFAVTVKLSALPLLLILIGLFLWREQGRIGKSLQVILLAAFPVLTVISSSFITTGCTLFPSSLLCFDVSWGVGSSTAREYSAYVNATAPRNMSQWLVLSSLCLAALVSRRKFRTSEGSLGVCAMAIGGIAFSLYFAPTTRFALGFLVLIPALTLATYSSDVANVLTRVTPKLRWALSFTFLSLLSLALILPLYKEFIYKKLRNKEYISYADRQRGDVSINEASPYWYLVPNRVFFSGEFKTEQGYDFQYQVLSPGAGNCWTSKLPCASNPELSFMSSIQLSDATKGLIAGFIRRPVLPPTERR